jgi:hypothetical protein
VFLGAERPGLILADNDPEKDRFSRAVANSGAHSDRLVPTMGNAGLRAGKILFLVPMLRLGIHIFRALPGN